MVSVITLTYKNYDGIFTTIASVLCQDWNEFEYIVSDDGCPDFPKRKIIDYINRNKKENLTRFEVLDNKKNVGTVKHLNSVIKRCSGEYIFELSCKDYFINKSVISDMINAFENEKCDVLIVNRLEYNQKGMYSICPHYREWKKIHKLNTRIKRYSALMTTEHYDMFIGPNVIYKKSVIERNGYFDENYLLFEDAPMIAKFLWNENVCIRPDLFAYCYDCETGISSPKVRNPILAADIKRYNLFGKLEHYDELPYKAKHHIRFGIERENTENKFRLFFIYLKYFPRIAGYLIYSLKRKVCKFGDKDIIDNLNITEFNKEMIT